MRTGMEWAPREGEGHVETEALPPAVSTKGKTDTGVVRGPTVCSLSYSVLVICYFLAWTPSGRSMES